VTVLRLLQAQAGQPVGCPWRRYWRIPDQRRGAGKENNTAGRRTASAAGFYFSTPAAAKFPGSGRMIDWLVEVFNSTKYPWFKDEFVHPSELEAV
jgi:hypothetical protein